MDSKLRWKNAIDATRSRAEKSSNVLKPQLLSPVFIMITGRIETGDFDPGVDNLYCRYAFSYGKDWEIIHGVHKGLSQISKKDYCRGVVWNFPIEISFKTTNAFGWPRVAVSVYGVDFFGRDTIQGYGSVACPVVPGQHTRDLHMYRPAPSSVFARFLAWIRGTRPEFYDNKFICQGDGRDAVRVEGTGKVRVVLDVTSKGMGAFGYTARMPSKQKH